jgi:predicted CXXCH cytochrome family protein
MKGRSGLQPGWPFLSSHGNPQQDHRMKRAAALAGTGLGLIAIWAVLASWNRGESQPAPDGNAAQLNSDGPPANAFLGDAACAECHEDQMRAHALSGHSHTILPAADASIASKLHGTTFHDPDRDVEFRYTFDDEGLSASLPGLFGGEKFPIDYAFGSGLHAVTFMTLVPDLSIPGESLGIEHRMSWITGHGAGVTPQDLPAEIHSDVEYFGRILSGERLHRCFGCHTTTCQIHNQQLVNVRPNVGCERCHGPGRDHVKAVNAGADDLAIRVTRATLDAEAEVAACAECHRGAELVPPDELYADNEFLVRFQPIGLSQSACYLQSDGKLGCSTCHDPHAPAASRTTAEYEAACLKCHGSGPTQAHCPVDQKSGCISCHMPPIDVLYTWKFHDHWIRVRKDSQRSEDASRD